MRRVWWVIGLLILLSLISVFLLIKTVLIQFSVQNNIPGYNFDVSALAANLFIKTQGYKTEIKNVNIIFTTEPQKGKGDYTVIFKNQIIQWLQTF
jgi:hypothetical protein